jgi:hypothetical protein
VPARFTAHVDDGSVPVDVTLVVACDAADLAPRCVELVLRQRAAGPAVTSSLLHNDLSVKQLVEEAVQMASMVGTVEQDGDRWSFTWTNESPEPTAANVRRITGPRKATPRRNAVSKADVMRAVRAYRRHKGKTKDPLRAAADELAIARATVHTRIKRARKEGWADV